MARLRLAGVTALLAASAAAAQDSGRDTALRAAGVCARCHVNAVLEWDLSAHARVGNACSGCHGASRGHVLDERNTVKPDRIPRGDAIAGLCATCHAIGCPKTRSTESCPSCHHVHALVDPRKPVGKPAESDAPAPRFTEAMRAGNEAVARKDWAAAVREFRGAYAIRQDAAAYRKLAFSLRRLYPEIPGFRAASKEVHPELGLPLEVKVTGTKIRMLLVAGGEIDLGDDSVASLRPAHTVAVEPFYIARDPFDAASWRDAMNRMEDLNRAVPGGGFRLPTEAELASAWSDPRLSRASAEWSSSLFWPYPYDAADGREDRASSENRVRLVAQSRSWSRWSGGATSTAQFRPVRTPPPILLPKTSERFRKRTP
jgi:hypothetical protein